MTTQRLLSILFLLLSLGASSGAFSQVSCPENIDFEDGTTSIWNFYTGNCCPGGVIVATTSSGAVTNRHTLMSGTGTDAYGGFPVVAPGGGSYSLKLGNANTGRQAEKARYYVNVPTGVTNYALIYRFAVVLEDPTSHGVGEKPRFEVNASDSATGVDIPCAQYAYVSTSSLPGFTRSSRGGGDVFYKSWSTANINLSGLGGTTVVIDFASGDCDRGGHFGYGYIDMSCGLFAISNSACDTSNIALSAPPGFDTYSWYDSTDFSRLLDTGQTVSLTAGSPRTFAVVLNPYSGYGCPDTLYTRVTPSLLRLNPTPDTTICFSTGLTLTSGATDIVSPLTYAWSSSGTLTCTTCATPFVNPTTTTSYYVTVTNPYGCSATDTINIVGDIITVDIDHTDVSCYGRRDGSATVTITSGAVPLTYAWTTSPVQTGATAVLLPAGIYSVVLTDTNGCTGLLTDTIGSPPAHIIAFASSTNPTTCDGSDGSITISGLPPSSTDTLEYRRNGIIYRSIVNATASGTYTFTGLPRGVYDTFTVITQGCPYNIIGPLTLSDPAFPPFPYAASNSPICLGDTLRITSLSAGTGITYSWQGPGGFTSAVQNPIITPSTYRDSGMYRIEVNRANCIHYDSTWVVIKPKPLTAAYTNSPLCAGDTLRLTSYSSNGAELFRWDGPNVFSSREQYPTIAPTDTLASGIYTVTITLAGCYATVTTPVIVHGVPTAPIVADTVYCQYDVPVALNAVGINLLWYANSLSGPGSRVAPIPPTNIAGESTWLVTQTSPAGCTGPASTIKVNVVSVPVLSLHLSDTVACVGGYVTLTATNTGEAYTKIKWETGDGDSIINTTPLIHSYVKQGVYTITVSTNYDICGVKSVQRNIAIFDNPIVDLGPDTTICSGNSVVTLSDNLNFSNPNAKWAWSTGANTPTIPVTAPGVYYLKVIINGCEVVDSVVVTDGCYLNIPNAFTPNGDGINDTYMPRPLMVAGATSFKMSIYNRWGQEVFQTSRVDGGGWDGKFNGVLQPEGVYIYMIQAVFIDGSREEHHGNLTLLR